MRPEAAWINSTPDAEHYGFDCYPGLRSMATQESGGAAKVAVRQVTGGVQHTKTTPGLGWYPTLDPLDPVQLVALPV